MTAPRLIDSHAHLTYEPLRAQIDDVMQRARDAGVERVISIVTRPTQAGPVFELINRFPGAISHAVGIHPHEAASVDEVEFDCLSDLIETCRPVAVGEMGLDYHYDFAPRDIQRRVFERQLEIAAPHDLPIVIHSREAVEDTVAVLESRGYVGRRVVFHCFTGTSAEAALIASKGWRISFTGVVTFKNSGELQQIARTYPGDQIMVETDAPYLSPTPVRSKRPCEPSFVAHTARFLADLRGEAYEDFCAQTLHNTMAFFRLPTA